MVVTESYNVLQELGLQSDATNCLLVLSLCQSITMVRVFMQDCTFVNKARCII